MKGNTQEAKKWGYDFLEPTVKLCGRSGTSFVVQDYAPEYRDAPVPYYGNGVRWVPIFISKCFASRFARCPPGVDSRVPRQVIEDRLAIRRTVERGRGGRTFLWSVLGRGYSGGCVGNELYGTR